jgi:hypothetical protein
MSQRTAMCLTLLAIFVLPAAVLAEDINDVVVAWTKHLQLSTEPPVSTPTMRSSRPRPTAASSSGSTNQLDGDWTTRHRMSATRRRTDWDPTEIAIN